MTSISITPTQNTVLQIPRRRGLSYDEFAQAYLYPHQPVIIEEAVRWKALARWSPEFFKTQFGPRHIPVGNEEMSVSKFVDRVLHATETSPSPYFTGAGPGKFLADIFPELTADVEPVPEYLFPNWLGERYLMPFLGRRFNRGPKAEIFFGGKGSGFPYVHWDSLHFHAFNVQIYGQKHWYLFSPEQSDCLYPKKEQGNKSSVVDVLNPDLEQFPLFAKATCHQNTLGPGDMIFVPAGWWHTTRVSDPSISVAIDSANASNWKALRSDVVGQVREKLSLLAPVIDFYLKFIGWRKSRRDGRRNRVHRRVNVSDSHAASGVDAR